MRWLARLVGLFLVCSLLAGQGFAVSQPPTSSPPVVTQPSPDLEDAGTFVFRSFTDRDGLPQNTVTSLAFDARGYLWVGTQDGAAFYNDRTWTVVNLPTRNLSNYIYTILCAQDGALWFGTNGGGLLRLKDDQWQQYQAQEGKLPGNEIRCLLESIAPDGKQSIWVGTSNQGLAKLENNTWTCYTTKNSGLPHDRITSLFQTTDPDGKQSLWVGTVGGLGCLKENQWTTFTTKNSGLPKDGIFCITQTLTPDGKRTLWAGTAGGGLARLDQEQWTVYDTSNSGLPNNIVRTLLPIQEPDGSTTLWIGTYGGGIVRFARGQWQVFNHKTSGLLNDGIWTIGRSPGPLGATTLWIGMLSGLARLKVDQWKVYQPSAEQTQHVPVMSLLESITENRRSLWVGSAGGGLSKLENGQWVTYDTQNSGLPNNRVLDLLETKGTDGSASLWIATNGGGLATLKNGQWTVYNTKNSGIPHDLVWSLQPTRTGDGKQALWVATYGGGIALFDETGKWTVWDTTNSKIPNNLVMCLYLSREADGSETLWAGTDGGGLGCFRNGQWTTFHSTNSMLPNNVVMSVEETEGPGGSRQMWVGTAGGGAVRFDPAHPTAPWLHLTDTSNPPLPNTTVNQICLDAQKRVYLFTNKGISRLTPRSPTTDNPAAFELFTYTTEDGLPSMECNLGASLVDSRGNIWAGTVEGTVMLSPAKSQADRVRKPLHLERILINGQEWRRSEISRVQSPTLSYDENNLVFEYSLLSYVHEDATTYQVQLLGFDDAPSPWKKDFKKEYTRLPAGSYEFRVWGRDYAGNITEGPQLRFRIQPAPWLTWWAFLVYIGIGASAMYGMYEWRVQQLFRRQQERLAHLRQLQDQRVSTLRQLLESIRVINSELDFSTVLKKIAEEGAQLVEGEPGGIGLIEKETVVFRPVWINHQWHEEPLIVQFGEGIAGKAAQKGQTVIVNDASTFPEADVRERLARDGIFGLMNVPIFSRTGKIVGILDVRRPKDRAAFTESDRRIAESFAHQAAIVIEKAALYSELEEKNLMIVESMRELQRLYQQEQEVSRSLQELDQMKNNFLIVTSHELRTPLTVISGYTEILLDEFFGQLTDKQRQSLKTCREMTSRMTDSLNNILEMLRISEGYIILNPGEHDLAQIIRNIIRELQGFAHLRNQRLLAEVPPTMVLTIDAEKIELLLLNLIQNAIKFTHDHGEINVRLRQEAGEIHIVVEDSGIGIDPGEVDRIFDKFYTSNDPSTHMSGRYEFSARGTGLGLSIAKSYAEAHGGRIWAESTGKGRGSRFHVTLPLQPKSTHASSDQLSTSANFDEQFKN